MEVLRSVHQMRDVDGWKQTGTAPDEEEYTRQYCQQQYVCYGFATRG
jgi:hypothetical protein